MSKNILKAIGLFLGALLLATAGWAQSTTTGAVGGVVSDPSGAIVAGAQVSARNMGTNSVTSAAVDGTGRFHIALLQPGQYTVEITATGFEKYIAGSVIVEIGRTTSLDVTLGLAGQKQTVEVTGEAPVITTDRSDMTMNINEASMSNLPINGRRWSSFALSTPGAVPDGTFGLISFRGISGLLNNNTVDGGDNNQAFFAEEKGRTRINYSISQSAIQEFQVNTSNFSAEYGRSAGGVVNAVTKSGTNSIHGEAFWYDRDNGWGATNPFTMVTSQVSKGVFKTYATKPKDKRHQFGGNVGGAIINDKLFYFFSFEQQKRNFPAVANASNPSAFFSGITVTAPASCTATNLTEGNILSCRGVSQTDADAAMGFINSLVGIVPRKGDETLFFPKLDWNVSAKNHFSASFNRVRWNSPAGIQTQAIVFRGLESFGDDFVKDDTLIARLVTTLSSTSTNEFRFHYGRDFEYEFTQPSIAGEPVSSQGISPQITIGGNAGIVFGKPNFLDRRAYPDEKSYQFTDTYSHNHGRHFLKAGVDIVRFHELMDSLFTESGAYSYSNRVNFISDYLIAMMPAKYDAPLCGGLPCYTSFTQGFGPTRFEFSTVDYGIFFNDDWHLSSRLTVNLGLRWDYERLPNPQIANPALPGTNNFPHDKDNFGPRVGMAWDITGKGNTVLRGGYGIYYGRIINSTISNAITNTGMTTGQLSFTYLPSTTGAPNYPNALPPPSTLTVNRPDVIEFSPDMQNPLIHEFDASFEQKLASNMAFSISYMGSIGRQLPMFVDTNLNSPTQKITYKVFGGLDDTATFTFPLFTGARPNAAFGRITDISSLVNSRYNAFVFKLEKRMSHGVQLQGFYTYAHARDMGQSSQTFTSANNVLNVYDLDREWARSNFDQHHRISLSGIWQPSFYKGENAVIRTLAQGFTIAPILTVASGLPYTAGINGNPPSGISPAPTSLGVIGAGGSNRMPTFERNAFQMPRTVNMDLRIAKKFNVQERLNLELFGEAFNIFNHVNATSVGTTMYTTGGTAAAPKLTYNSGFGVVTSSSGTLLAQRQIQIGIKLAF